MVCIMSAKTVTARLMTLHFGVMVWYYNGVICDFVLISKKIMFTVDSLTIRVTQFCQQLHAVKTDYHNYNNAAFEIGLGNQK